MNIPSLQRRVSVVTGAGIFAFVWVFARACVQSITIDEADTYLAYVARQSPSHWEAVANNHVLNSLLIRLFTSIFGLSPLTMRLPALIGAALYIGSAICIVRMMTHDRVTQLPLVVALVFNPFVMDYLVAARGYSLGLGFSLCAIAVGLQAAGLDLEASRGPLLRACVLCSCCVSLSFCANFSFAFVDIVCLALIGSWTCLRISGALPQSDRYRCYALVVASLVLPGLLVAAFFTGSILLAWPHNQLVAGTKSLFETVASVIRASLYEPNPYLLSPPLHEFLKKWSHVPLLALGTAALVRLIVVASARRMAPADAASRWAKQAAWFFLGLLVLTLAAHRLAYRLFHLLLPVDRTAVFLAPICTLLIGAVAVIPVGGLVGHVSRKAVQIALIVVSGYYLCCLRLTYFREWGYNADSKTIYNVVSYYRQRYRIQHVASHWRYVAVLNYYRAQDGGDTIAEIPPGPGEVGGYPLNSLVYVIYYPSEQGFAAAQGLKIVYHSQWTDAAVAIRPEIESAAVRRQCGLEER